jgi:hypothetical protein
MSMKLSLKEALARQAEWREKPQEPSVSLAPNVWIVPGQIEHPVSLAKAFMTLGIGLSAAHHALNRLAAREAIAMGFPRDVAAIAAVLEPFGVTVTAYQTVRESEANNVR